MPASGQWPVFTKARRRHELMDHMMQRLGVDVLIAIGLEKGQAFVRARAQCRQCPHESKCRVWLTSSKQAPQPPDFCPNTCFFHKCGLLGSYGLWREHRSIGETTGQPG